MPDCSQFDTLLIRVRNINASLSFLHLTDEPDHVIKPLSMDSSESPSSPESPSASTSPRPSASSHNDIDEKRFSLESFLPLVRHAIKNLSSDGEVSVSREENVLKNILGLREAAIRRNARVSHIMAAGAETNTLGPYIVGNIDETPKWVKSWTRPMKDLPPPADYDEEEDFRELNNNCPHAIDEYNGHRRGIDVDFHPVNQAIAAGDSEELMSVRDFKREMFDEIVEWEVLLPDRPENSCDRQDVHWNEEKSEEDLNGTVALKSNIQQKEFFLEDVDELEWCVEGTLDSRKQRIVEDIETWSQIIMPKNFDKANPSTPPTNSKEESAIFDEDVALEHHFYSILNRKFPSSSLPTLMESVASTSSCLTEGSKYLTDTYRQSDLKSDPWSKLGNECYGLMPYTQLLSFLANASGGSYMNRLSYMVSVFIPQDNHL